MVSAAIKEGIEKQLEQLPVEMQRRVLDFAEALALSRPRGVPGRDLLAYAGGMSREDADEMLSVIEQGCEKVDLDGW